MFAQIRILTFGTICLWAMQSNAMEKEVSVGIFLDQIDDNMVFYYSDYIIQQVQKNQTAVLDDLLNRIENHAQTGPVLPQLFFTLLLRFSQSFGNKLVKSVCANIEYMYGQNLANSFEAFKVTMYDSDLELNNTFFGSKQDILETLINWLMLLSFRIEESRKSSDSWNQESALQEACRINVLLEECKKLAKQHKSGNI